MNDILERDKCYVCNLENIDKLYIPLKYFYLKEYSNIIKQLTEAKI